MAATTALLALALCAGAAQAADLTAVIPVVKRAVVGIGNVDPMRSPATMFFGTGFVVGDGHSVITNAHVVKDMLEHARDKPLGVVVPEGDGFQFRQAELVASDSDHDLAHLRVSGPPLPALELGDSDSVQEGQSFALTGYPLGMVLGLHAATHRAMVAAITPIVAPSLNANRLDARQIAALQRASYTVFQLDGTAFPGNSGSPVYDPGTGRVLAVVNAGFVKGLKENAISNPSGITYAIPAKYVQRLLQQK
jgi:S1-C subfamily serine protease